jgi:hypothetical protein
LSGSAAGKKSGSSGGSSFAAGAGLAGVDLSSAEAKAALAVRSAYAEQGTNEVVERALGKTAQLEVLEAMESKMRETVSREVTKWACAQCERFYDAPPASCRAEGHDVSTSRKREWRFKCVGCGHRTYHGAKLCAKPCDKCGKFAWTAASIFNLKEGGTTLASTAQLRTHGDAVTESLRGMTAHDFSAPK